ncbi:DUF4870 domain-containing protein [Evansella halocellulosilytica]|uniref:DUF4870 domain-containing protein n=1 Tax=Evansella halocellulosilytica TaxID=2011013 RepID=UPI000BB912D9|nr:DUF4870 domain-containing protein [Evansella halocellulosilytica]
MNEATPMERVLGSIAHFLAIIPIPIGNIILTFTYWLLMKSNSEFVNRQGKESLNLQISITLYSLLIFIIMYTIMTDLISGTILIGIFAVLGTFTALSISIFIYLFYVVTVLITIVFCLFGREKRYPLIIRFIS